MWYVGNMYVCFCVHTRRRCIVCTRVHTKNNENKIKKVGDVQSTKHRWKFVKQFQLLEKFFYIYNRVKTSTCNGICCLKLSFVFSLLPF